MSSQNLIIYKFNPLYQILEEIGLDINFNIISINDANLLNDKIKNLNNYLILSNKEKLDFQNQIILDEKPINILKLIEKINIEFLRLQFNNQSHMKINKYIIDLNSREILHNDIKLKLTEKETNIILYLSKEVKPVNVEELQENVWGYQSDIETHIYRLRKKFLDTFSDNEFIISKKNGYQIR